MGSLVQAVRGFFGGGAQGQSDKEPGAGTGIYQNKALQYTQDKWNDRKNAFVVYHQSIWQALLFYVNQSWIDWDDARKVWQPQQPTDEWIPRPRINRFSPTMDAVASNFASLPEVEAVPKAEDDPQSHTIAAICTDLIEYAVVKEGLKHQQGQEIDKVGLAAQQFVLCGGVFSTIRKKQKKIGQQPKQAMGPAYGFNCPTCDTYKTTNEQKPPDFCSTCGSPVTADKTETLQPQMDEMGQPIQEDVLENDLECDIGNMLWAFPRPGATSLKDSQDLLWAQRRTVEEIHFRWDFEAQPDAIWPDGYSVTYEHALNFWYTGYSNTTIQVKDSCMVLEMYVPPEHVKDFPNGFYQVVINDRPAYFEDWNFPEHPQTMACYLALPTLFFPRSISFDCVEIQRELNAYESLIKLHAMVSAVDPIVADIRTKVSDITGRADKVIWYSSIVPDAEPPHRMGHGSLDDGVYKQRESLHAEFQNISMAVNAFRGQQEGAVTAASAIQQLRSQAELMFSKPSSNWRNFWRDTLRKYVKFMQKYFSFPQLVKILGEGRDEEIRAFMGADLDSIVDWVASDHGLPRTRDELRQEMMTMFDKGALDINDPAVQQKAHELFGETGMKQAFSKHATNARLENQEFKNGKSDMNQPGVYVPPQIHPQPLIEDLAVHLYFHKDQAISQDFKKWPPQAQQALIEHIMETTQAIAMQMSTAPTPPGAPGLAAGKNVQGQNPQSGPPVPVQGAPPAQ